MKNENPLTPDQQKHLDLCAWLSGPACKQEYVLPCHVTIGSQTWLAAAYTNSRGEVAIYCVGELPHAYRSSSRRDRTCFPFRNQDWYVACYGLPSTAEDVRYREFHPFGASFILMPWGNSEPIDAHERRPYFRQPLTVLFV